MCQQKVNEEHLMSMLNGPFSQPRNHQWDKFYPDEATKEDIAVYIWQKLGLFSGFNCVQKFFPPEGDAVIFTLTQCVPLLIARS